MTETAILDDGESAQWEFATGRRADIIVVAQSQPYDVDVEHKQRDEPDTAYTRLPEFTTYYGGPRTVGTTGTKRFTPTGLAGQIRITVTNNSGDRLTPQVTVAEPTVAEAFFEDQKRLFQTATYTENTLPDAPAEGMGVWNTDRKAPMWADGTDFEVPVIGDDVLTSATVVGNTTTETEVFSATLDAGSMQVGRVYEARLLGDYTTNDGTDTFTLRVKVGGTQMASITSTGGNVSNAPLSIQMTMTVQSVGASGTVVTHTEGVFDDEHKDVHHQAETLDTTVAEDIVATMEWDVAESGDTAEIRQGYVSEIG